jgi:hypothetical protein
MPGPVNPVVDHFTRADESPIAAPWVVWYPGAGLPVLSGNAMHFPAGGWAAYDDPQPADQECFYTIAAHVTSRTLVLGVRFNGLDSGALNGYTFEVNTATGVGSIRRFDATAPTTLGATFTQANAVGDAYRLWAQGDTIGVDYKPAAGDWAELATRTDSTYAGSGYVVAGGDDVNLAIDDFGYGPLGASSDMSVRVSGAWVPADRKARAGGAWV